MTSTTIEPPHLETDMKTLCLSTITAHWRPLAERAASQRQAPADYLARLVHLKVTQRRERRITHDASPGRGGGRRRLRRRPRGSPLRRSSGSRAPTWSGRPSGLSAECPAGRGGLGLRALWSTAGEKARVAGDTLLTPVVQSDEGIFDDRR